MRKILYLSDAANWVLDEIGRSLETVLQDRGFARAKNGILNFYGINHYANRYAVFSKVLWLPGTKKILTYFHGEDSDTAIIDQLNKVQERFTWIHTSCEFTRQHLIKHGVAPDKICVIPIGIDVANFSPVTPEKRQAARQKFQLPLDAYVIGSFQKDGNGWGEGDEPKLIKGPDVFCDAVEKIHKQQPVHVFLTGPSRGYVKNRLAKAKIPFTHVFLENYLDLQFCYHAINAYIVASRVEGGPRAPMESFASGIPVVSTCVGQVPELMRSGENGFVTEVEDADAIARAVLELVRSPELGAKFVLNGIQDVQKYDYKNIAETYWQKMYQPLLEGSVCSRSSDPAQNVLKSG